MGSFRQIDREGLVVSAVEQPSRSPEDRLMLAVLQDALATFQRGLRSSIREDIEQFREVDRWLRSRDFDGIFSFESICDSLGIDSALLRNRLNEARVVAFESRRAGRARGASADRRFTRRTWYRGTGDSASR